MKVLKRIAVALAILVCLAPAIVNAQIFPSGPPTNSLSSWSFSDTNFWTSDLNYSPLSFTNLVGGLYGDGTSLMVDSTNPAWLQFGGFNGDGSTNLSVGPSGSIFFWFSPNWASATTNSNGAGPGEFGRLLEAGAYSTNATYGWFSLFVDPGATNIYFATQTNSGDGAVYTNLTAPIDWATNAWQFVALTYSPTNLSLYTNGVMATNAPALVVYPGLNVLTNGFWIGSDSNGILQMHGWMDDLYAYNYSLDPTTISNIYSYFYGLYVILPYHNVMAEDIHSAPSSPSYGPPYDAVSGSGYLAAIGTNTTSCISSSQVWITNVTAVASGTNMLVTFVVAGGSNGVPYDVFANSLLDFSQNTNTAWAWMGQSYQCVTNTLLITNSSTCFLILGTPLQGDYDGLTIAYKELVTRTDPNTPDPVGDGIAVSDKVLLGLNPHLAYPAIPSNPTINSCPQ